MNCAAGGNEAMLRDSLNVRKTAANARITATLFAASIALVWSADAAAQESERSPDAVELYERAQRAFGAGEFGEAAALLERAYALEHDPVLLYNRARALQNAGDDCEAAYTYRRYLTLDPNASERDAIEVRASALEESCEAAREPDPPPRDETPPARGPELLGASVTLGIGLATVALAAALGSVALERRGYAEDPNTSMRDARDAGTLADDLAMGSNVAWAIGGSVALAGLAWLIGAVILHRPSEMAAQSLTIHF
jgi:tetratricopeptide (TPR) repeat protein